MPDVEKCDRCETYRAALEEIATLHYPADVAETREALNDARSTAAEALAEFEGWTVDDGTV